MNTRLSAVLASAVLASSGCYLAHTSESSGSAPDGTVLDAGLDGPEDAVVDAQVDGGMVEPRCTLERRAEILTARDESGNFNAPDLFWTGERVGVVLNKSNESTGEHGVVAMTHVDSRLTEAVPVRRVGEESHSWGEAAWNGAGFGVCWNGDPAGVGALRFREVEGLDGALGERTRFETEAGSCLDLAFGHGRYALTWRHVYRVEDETLVDTQVQVMERDGTRRGEPFTLGTREYAGYSAELEATSDGFVAVAANGDALRVVHLDQDGGVTRDRSAPWPGLAYANFARRGDQLGVLGLVGPRDVRSLEFRVLNRDLSVAVSRPILDGAPTASYPRVLARPEGWLLIWGEGSRPTHRGMMLSLDPRGRPLMARREFRAGTHSGYGGPSLLSADGAVFIGLSHKLEDAPDGSREFTFVERWECTGEEEDLCQAQDAMVPGAGDCSRSFFLGYRYDGAECVPLYDCDSGCAGADCDRLYQSRFACESDRRECARPMCELAETPANEVCGPTDIPSRQPNWLSVSYGGSDRCPCERPTCVVAPTGSLELTVTLPYCVDDVPDCDCFDPDPVRPAVPCALPPLSPGTWTVNLPGRDSIDLTVRPYWETPMGGESCR